MEIRGIWKNNTAESIAVIVNGENYSGSIDPSGASPLMRMSLSGLMMLDVIITNSTELINPILLWETDDLTNPSILQQPQRFSNWESMLVHKTSPFEVYRFTVAELDGGLLIVGTVELVEDAVPTHAG